MNKSPRASRRARNRQQTAAGPRARGALPPQRSWRDRLTPPVITVAIGAIAIVGLLSYVVIDQLNEPTPPEEDASAALPGDFFPEIGRSHLAAGQAFDAYTSNPPTSGPHAPSPAAWGISENPIAKETLVHNMEHGGVLVLYNCPDGCDDVTSQLEDYVSERLGRGDFLVMAPFPGMDSRIALVSWTRLDTFDELDIDRVDRFADAHLCRYDPENICG